MTSLFRSKRSSTDLKVGSNFELSPYCELMFVTPGPDAHFFGYYTHSPVSSCGRRLLAHRSSFDGRDVRQDDSCEIGWFDLLENRWNSVARTSTFNWQQGALLQWLGGPGNRELVFNCLDGDQFASTVVNVESGARRHLPRPVYAVHPSGDYAVTGCFERYRYCRAYHYECDVDAAWKQPVHPDDGIYLLDLVGGKYQQLISTALLAERVGGDTQPHWLDHMVWNPSGTRFAFLHRWGIGEEFSTELCTVGFDGTELWRAPTNEYTHIGWRSDQEFVIYANESRAIRQAYSRIATSGNSAIQICLSPARWAKRRLLPTGVREIVTSSGRYIRVRDQSGVLSTIKRTHLPSDGHPSWTPDGRFMLTDTYEDSASRRHLLLFDSAHGRVTRLARFYSPYNSCGYRCDLHPRFSPDTRAVAVDTAHDGTRQIMVLRINWDTITRDYHTTNPVSTGSHDD